MSANSTLLRWSGVVVAGAAVLGCSVLYDLSPDQCGATSECVGRFGKGFVCDDGLCQKTGAVDEVEGGVSGCKSHAQCIEEHGDIDPTACIDGECVLLKSEECPLLLPMRDDGWLHNLTTSDAIILGAYSPIPDSTLVSNFTRYDDLAVTDLSQEVQGLPGSNGKRRQVVMVVCDGETPKGEHLLNSATHLIDELRVPGIVSTLQSADLQYVFEQKAKAANTFIMSALDADDAIINLQDNGLVWTMLAGPDQVSVTFAPLLDRVVEYLRGPGAVLGSDEKVRVALVAPTGEPRLLEDMGQAINDTIKFNGKDAGDNYPDNFRLLDIETVYGNQLESEDQSEVIGELLEFRPHVIIAMAANEFLTAVIPGLEDQWIEDSDQPRPFYVLSPYHLNSVDLATALTAGGKIRQRMVGVGYAAAENPKVYRDYLSRFEGAYNLVGETSHLGQENFYDAPYYLLYAAAAAGNPPRLTGSALAQGMTRLISGRTQYEIGRKDMVEAMGLLQANVVNTITLEGTLGLAKFDPNTGARNDAGSVFCIDDNGVFVPDVLRWDVANEEFSDAASNIGEQCIEGF